MTQLEVAVHTVALFRHDTKSKKSGKSISHLVLYDPNEPFWFGKVECAQPLKYAERFGLYKKIGVYCLQGRTLTQKMKGKDQDEEYRINNEMKFVMTGKWDPEYEKTLEQEGQKKSNKAKGLKMDKKKKGRDAKRAKTVSQLIFNT